MAKGVNRNQAERAAKLKGITLGQAYQDYLANRQLTPNTLRDYSRAMRAGFDDWADKPITSLNRNMIEQRFNQLSQDHGNAQANQRFRFLRALLNFSMERYSTQDGEPLIPSNPCNR